MAKKKKVFLGSEATKQLVFHVNRHKVLYQVKGNHWQKHSVPHGVSSYLLSPNTGLLVTGGSAAHRTKLICYVAQNSMRSCICTVSSSLEHNLLHVSANNGTERDHWLRELFFPYKDGKNWEERSFSWIYLALWKTHVMQMLLWKLFY